MDLTLFWRICQFDRYRNISLSLKNVMFVIAQLVLGGVFCGNQSNCRICILIGECWNGMDSLEILEHCRISRIAWKGWKTGMSCRTHGWISRRSPCLLCVEFLFWNEGLFALCSSSTRRALCLLYVELDSGWRILWMYCNVV